MRFYLLILLGLFSCIKPSRDFEKYKAPEAPDYSRDDAWAALPWMKDSADVVPRGSGLSDGQKDAKVDVFFIHPTSYFSRKGWNQDLRDKRTNKRTNTGSIMNQSTVFNGSCAVYAPRYRQATLYSFVDRYGNKPSANKNGEKALAFAYQDVRAAFLYFLSHHSKGRPFIIASHSQGTWHARTLIKEIVEKDTALLTRFVAAYIIGGGTEKKEFSVIHPCDSAGQTGCFVCWNSMKWGNRDPHQKDKELECVNPITWKRDGKISAKQEGKGGSPYKLTTVHPQHVCAECHDGILWVTKPKRGNYLQNVKNYHNADYNLFWLDIRKNVDDRVGNYLLRH